MKHLRTDEGQVYRDFIFFPPNSFWNWKHRILKKSMEWMEKKVEELNWRDEKFRGWNSVSSPSRGQWSVSNEGPHFWDLTNRTVCSQPEESIRLFIAHVARRKINADDDDCDDDDGGDVGDDDDDNGRWILNSTVGMWLYGWQWTMITTDGVDDEKI